MQVDTNEKVALDRNAIYVAASYKLHTTQEAHRVPEISTNEDPENFKFRKREKLMRLINSTFT